MWKCYVIAMSAQKGIVEIKSWFPYEKHLCKRKIQNIQTLGRCYTDFRSHENKATTSKAWEANWTLRYILFVYHTSDVEENILSWKSSSSWDPLAPVYVVMRTLFQAQMKQEIDKVFNIFHGYDMWRIYVCSTVGSRTKRISVIGKFKTSSYWIDASFSLVWKATHLDQRSNGASGTLGGH